jgi:2-polyprenyl-6-methoxyphenol hydroxylase-like FAD-dependent oxidoreductase
MNVLISGASVAGPALAWWLARTGARVTILEKTPTLMPIGQNIDLHGSSVTIAKKMGILQDIRDFNTTEVGTKFVDSNGKAFATMPLTPGASVSPTNELEILRGDLAKVFYKATKGSPNIEYRFGTTVKRVISNDDEAVEVELSDGRVEKYDLLVAADGQWSKLRKANFPPDVVQIRDYNLFAVYWTTDRLPSDDRWWNIYQATGSRSIGTRPDPYGNLRASILFVPPTESQRKAWDLAARSDKQAQVDLVRNEYAHAGWETDRLLAGLDKAEDFYFHAIQQNRMSEWSQNRIVCLGDAAWAPTPLTGMGASLAMIGGYVLAGELTKLGPGEHPRRALEAFDKALRPFVEKVQDVPTFVPRLIHPYSSVERWFTQSLLSVLSKVAQIPWVIKRLYEPIDMEDYVLPDYPRLTAVEVEVESSNLKVMPNIDPSALS